MLAALAGTAAIAVAAIRFHDFPERSLDHRPYPMRAIDLAPPAAQYIGKLRMEVHIAADGTVTRVDVLESSLPGAFQQSAERAFREARWEPGRKWGLAVGTVKLVEIEVKPPNGAL